MSVMVFSLAAMTRRVHSTRRGPRRVMFQIRGGLGARADREALCHGAEAEAGNLRKDEPHPMCLLPTVRQFLDDLPVDRGLRVHKAPEVEQIVHAATPSTVTRTGLSALPDSL
jgi:hypothetical protein